MQVQMHTSTCTRTHMHARAHAHTHTHIHNSYLTVIGVHKMYGRMHPNYCQITILLVVDLHSSLVNFMMTHPFPIAGKLPIKTWVARQLPTISLIYSCSCIPNSCLCIPLLASLVSLSVSTNSFMCISCRMAGS